MDRNLSDINRGCLKATWMALCLMLLLTLGFGPLAYAANHDAPKLENIKIKPLSSGKIQVTLNFSKAVKLPKTFMTQAPARIVIDLFGVEDALEQQSIVIDKGAIQGYRALSTEDRTRVMFELSEPASYTVNNVGNSVVMVLTTRNSVAKKVTRERKPHEYFKANKWSSGSHQIKGVDFHRDSQGGGEVIVNLSDASMGIDIKQANDKLVVNFMDTSVPKRLQRRLDVTDFGTPVNNITTVQTGRNTRVVIGTRDHYQHLAYQVNNKFIIDVNPETKAEAAARKKKEKKYTGQRLSLNFQDIEVRAVLQLLAEFTGVNIVASDTVTGNLTLRLNNVPWDEALDIILKTQGLAMRKMGSVLLIAPSDEVAAREKDDLASQKEIEELEPLQTVLLQLNYAKAPDVANLLKDQTSSLLSSRGNVTVDARTNAILVQDTLDKLNEVRDLIKKLDIPVKQVLIEARLVNVDTNFEQDIGIQFGITKPAHVSGTINGANQINNNVLGDVDKDTTALIGVPVENRLNVNLPATIDGVQAPSFGVALARLGKGYLLDLELSAIESEGAGEVISSPRLVTANEQEAYIEQGEEIPYQEATSSGATSVEFKKAVLSLRVTPQITPDGKIIMDIKVNQDRRSNEPEVLGVPAIDTQQIETQVLVDNGQTIVLGGIYRQTKAHQVRRVPFLGELPVVGYLFRNTEQTSERRELLIFITPKIIEQMPLA